MKIASEMMVKTVRIVACAAAGPSAPLETEAYVATVRVMVDAE